MIWFGISKKIAPKTWLNCSQSGPSITRSLGKGVRINFSPKRGCTLRFSKRLGKWW